MDKDELIDVLTTLVETSRDGEYGFRLCAEYARAAALRALLQRYAEDCRQAALDLQTVIERHGGVADVSGSVAGALHRGWVAARNRLSGYDDDGLVEECERGEDLALRQYADAIANPLPADVHALVQRQLEGVTRHHDHIRRLRDELHAGT